MKRAFPGSGPEVDAKYERAGHFLLATLFGKTASRTWCDKSGVRITRAAGDGIGSGGGFLVPPELEQAILDLRDTYGAFRRRACVYPMSSDSAIFPRRTGAANAYFFSENTAATATSTTMDAVELSAKKLGALVTVSSELAEDSIHDIVDYVTNELAWAFAVKEDQCAFNGDGTSTYGGMRGLASLGLDGSHNMAKVTAASGHNTFSLLTGSDLNALMGAVRGSALGRAAWFVSNLGFSDAIANASTGGFLDSETVDGVTTRFFNGFPVIPTQALPQINTSLSGKVMMAFGDMYAGAVLGQRRGLTIARSFDRYLDTDQLAILATERFDAVIHDMGDNTTYGSLAVLVAP